MAIKGGFLRLAAITCYFIAFCSAVVITGSFAWFTVRHHESRNIATLVLGGATLLYTIFNTIFTCCTAGIAFFAFTSILFDIVFTGAMIAVAVLNRSATNGCDGPRYPRVVYEGRGHTVCRLFVASFAVAILAALMFVFTIIFQILIRSREKRQTYRSKGVLRPQFR
ncbi:hypothetical protein M409DRAFT_24958 [Zasmidium cellare ATCC 36951]|uniref:MARVEL domain-containing protein n=1 Tax=Zasmidium cellare ATCC 36951 TaxID=1080233 RepID=A0A6A6CEG8_ZASCE|nr:uncharacterized protein M409DRAFT_24958 [Zasmidium cellare ATCC 36951]KAF2164558.1 hypothetical protein M409DRAFT_24958 [Zasmidium cellare ATCC 36951]